MGINTKGNCESVLSADIKKLHIAPELSVPSMSKSITRHYVNLHFILPPTELSLINFLVFMSDSVCSFKYSTLLLNQYSKASERANSIYQTTHKLAHNTSLPSLRNAFINLVEMGLLVPLSKKGYYMVCPILVHNNNKAVYSPSKLLSEYSECFKSDNPSFALKCMCQNIKSKLDKKYKIVSENVTKNNTSKRR